MKTKFTLVVVLLSALAYACSDHLYRLALNQRNYYNPAAMCPYCKGSVFAGTGFSFTPNTGASGYFFSLGDDGENRLHGPWDLACGRDFQPNIDATAYSFRYAWRQSLGTWRLAGGFRASYTQMSYRISWNSETFLPAASSVFHSRYIDLDGGIMLTNQQGFYVGISALHLTQPVIKSSDAAGNHSQLSVKRDVVLMSGTCFPIHGKFDALPDLNATYDGSIYSAQPGLLLRYNHTAAIGGGVSFVKGETAQFEIRGGYTSSTFKWLGTVAFTPGGVVYETGLVVRFGVNAHNGIHFIEKIDNPCVGGTCSPVEPKPEDPWKKKHREEFDPHQ
jgi:hypothetical protein